MPRNRTIYNLQDVFFGLPSGRYDKLDETTVITAGGEIVVIDQSPVTRDAQTGDFQILRRIDRVQNASYSFNIPKEEANVLGRSTSLERPPLAPPEVSFNFSYLLRGIENENRLGFNVASQRSGSIPLFVKDMLNSSRLNDRRNIYLLINNENEYDIRNYEKIEDLDSAYTYAKHYLSFIDTGVFGVNYVSKLSGASFLMENEKANNFGMLIFQNSYLQSYSLEASIGSLTKVDVSYAADNAIYKRHAGRDVIPNLDTINGSISFDKNSYFIPKYWKEILNDPYWDQTFGPGDMQVEIIKQDNPKKNRIVADYDFEITFPSTLGSCGGNPSYTGESYASQSGLLIRNGAWFSVPPQVPGKKYTMAFWVKSVENTGKLNISHQNGNGEFSVFTTPSNASAFASTTEWNFYSNTQYSNASRDKIYITSPWDSNHHFVLDDFQFYEELDDITLHTEPLQSFKFSFDIARDNVSYLGHKLYFDRQPKLPVNVKIDLSTLAQENSMTSGSFLNNLAFDADYSFKVKFYDNQKNLRLFYDFHNARLDSANYSLSIGSNKTSDLSFSMQMDVEDDTQGVFVSGNFPELRAVLLDEHDEDITTDNGEQIVNYIFYWEY